MPYPHQIEYTWTIPNAKATATRAVNLALSGNEPAAIAATIRLIELHLPGMDVDTLARAEATIARLASFVTTR